MKFLITLLFVLSGSAALIYEVVWLHLLRLSLGVSAYSLGVVLAVFMGGLALGSALYAPLVSRDRHPLKVYACLEWAIGLFGLAMPLLLPAASKIYAAAASGGEGSLFMRIITAIVVLLPPTTLMGATLPTISRWVSRDAHGAAALGGFYTANIFGAVCGSLLAGLLLMQFFDARVASYFAAAINAVVGLVAWMMAHKCTFAVEPDRQQLRGAKPAWNAATACAVLALFCSGLTALSAEVVWTRLLTLSLGPTVYAFALVLAVFLTGLGLGSAAVSICIKQLSFPFLGLGLCQLFLLVTLPAAATSFSEMGLQTKSMWTLSFIANWPDTARDVVRCVITVGPSAILWGASFPFAIAAILQRFSDQAAAVGILSAANTAGAITGAVSTTFWAIPTVGSQLTQQALVVIAAAAGASCFAMHVRERIANEKLTHRTWFLALPAILTFGLVAASYVLPPSPAIFAYGREAAQRRRDAPILAVREGVHTPIVVTYWPQHHQVKALHLAGKLEASDDKIDLRLERMLAHLPQFLSDTPKSVLVVGLGAGITSGAFLMDDRTEELTICELEPALPPITAEYFKHVNFNALTDPRTRLVIDDGRHFLQTSAKRFDVISVDPIHPWVRGAAALYSSEFFNECLEHLPRGGIVSYWVPMHSMTVESVKSEIATFCQVFPYVMVWHTGGTMLQRHMLAIGSNEPFKLDLKRVDELTPPSGVIKASILEMQFHSVDEMLSLYLANKHALQDWLADAEINSDLSLRLEYLAGAAAYQNQREKIFREVIRYREWPTDLFRGDESRLNAIRDNLTRHDDLESYSR